MISVRYQYIDKIYGINMSTEYHRGLIHNSDADVMHKIRKEKNKVRE